MAKGKEHMDISFEQIKNDMHTLTLNMLAKSSVDDKTSLEERLYKMIDYNIKRYDWYMDQRYRFLTIGLALIAFSGAISPFLVSLKSNVPLCTFILILVIPVLLMATSVWIIFEYKFLLKGNEYPYRKIAEIRSWYFKYNLPATLSSKISKDSSEAKDQVSVIARAFENFVGKWLEFVKDDNRFILEDLEQVYILQLLQRYQRQSLTKMVSILAIGIITSVIFVCLAVISYLFLTKCW